MTVDIPLYKRLQELAIRAQNLSLKELFAKNPTRFDQFSLEKCGLFLDYSKNHITSEVMQVLVQLAQEQSIPAKIESLFSGKLINHTEKLPALHPLLRGAHTLASQVQHPTLSQEVQAVLDQMTTWTNSIRQGLWPRGTVITDIVNLGIGGSHLGPQFASQALLAYQTSSLRLHFLSTLDGQSCHALFKKLPRETTVFIISSKSFETKETLKNAETAIQWLQQGNVDYRNRCLAVTAFPEKAMGLGLSPNQVFKIWPWVGGRYSVWSAIGLPLALMIGMEHFKAFLAGAFQMDQHLQLAPLDKNMPVILALLSIWYRNFWGTHTHAILPYHQGLASFPHYLQQLAMESNGKRVNHQGHSTWGKTAPIIWGGMGGDAQHAFMQLLHQGTDLVPVDFIVPLMSTHPLPDYQDLLVSQCFSQSQALMVGRTLPEALEWLKKQGISGPEAQNLAPHLVIPGNRPSTTLLVPALTPATLGALMALYEHKTLVEGLLWEVNSFDQWGVELGKEITQNLVTCLQDPEKAKKQDSSTQGLLKYYQTARQINRVKETHNPMEALQELALDT